MIFLLFCGTMPPFPDVQHTFIDIDRVIVRKLYHFHNWCGRHRQWYTAKLLRFNEPVLFLFLFPSKLTGFKVVHVFVWILERSATFEIGAFVFEGVFEPVRVALSDSPSEVFNEKTVIRDTKVCCERFALLDMASVPVPISKHEFSISF